MKFLRAFIGYMIAGSLVMAVWGELDSVGIFGGYLAALIIIGPMWFMNHYVNLVGNPDDAAFVDMGLAIGVAGIFRDVFLNDVSALTGALPTIGMVALGAICGGLVAAAIEKNMAKDAEKESEAVADKKIQVGLEE